MNILKQSVATKILVFMTDSSDHRTGKTGLTLAIRIAKGTGAFAVAPLTVTEKEFGWYQIDLTSSNTDTLGTLAFHITATGADTLDFQYRVVSTSMDSLSADVWGYTLRTLSTPSALNYDVLDPTVLLTRRGDNSSFEIDGLGSLTGYSSIYFTVKNYTKDTDAQSIIQVAKKASGTEGLLYLNGSAVVTNNLASLTILDSSAGNIRIDLKPDVTKVLTVKDYVFDVQLVKSDTTVSTLSEGTYSVIGDVTRAVT